MAEPVKTEVNPADFEKLDDVMLAMDVVDTLRHEHIMLERDLGVEDRREGLIERLREIYKAQGIDVPDEVLMDGVKALEEERFQFTPAKPGFGTKLAHIYINRKKWLPLVYTIGAIIGGAWAVNYAAFTRPAHLENSRFERLVEKEIPAQLKDLSARGLATNPSADVKTKLSNMAAEVETALRANDAKAAQTGITALQTLTQTLEQSYDMRVVNRYGEDSGFFRWASDDQTIKNHYLVVEAISAGGKVIKVHVTDEEDKASSLTSKFAIRVPVDVFNAVASDKRDDRIIQNDLLGRKAIGQELPAPSFEMPDGYRLGFVTEW